MDTRIEEYLVSINTLGRLFGYDMTLLVMALGLFLAGLCTIVLFMVFLTFVVRTILMKKPNTALKFFITDNDGAFSEDKVVSKAEKKPFILGSIWLFSVIVILLCIVWGANNMLSTKAEASSIRSELLVKVANSENAELLKMEDFLTDSISLNAIGVTTFSYGGKDYLNKNVLYIDSSTLGDNYKGNTGLIKPNKGVLSALEKEFLPYYPYSSATSMRGQSLLDADFIYIVFQDEEDED